MIAWFARNGVAANLLMAGIIACGLTLVVQEIPVEIFPSTDSDTVVVRVSYPGATPEDVERGIITRIEEALQDVQGIDRIIATAQEAFASVRIEAESYKDGRELLNDVKTKVDAISTLPLDAESPVIELLDFSFEAITVVVSGSYEEDDIVYYTEQIRDELEQLPGVSQLSLGYVRDREINIEVSEDTLRQYGLSLSEVASAIGRNSLDLSAGNLRTSGGDILIRTRGQAYKKEEFERIVIRSFTDGSVLRLRDLAYVRDGFVDDELYSRLDGRNAAVISVDRAAQENVIDVTRGVRNYIERKRKELPKGMTISYWDDNSKIVRDRLSTLVTNAVQGSILILLLLALFLHPRVAFWVFLGLPVSFSGALIVMWITNGSLNIISLFAFILVLGVVVDDAIVTGENIYRYSKFSRSGLEAAINGTKEIAVPVTFGVITTVVAFLPMAFVGGDRGATFAQIPLVVVPALFFSWIESKLILPSHLSNFKESQAQPGTWAIDAWDNLRESFTSGFERGIVRYYMPWLSRCLRHRYLFVLFFSALLFLCVSLVASGWVRFVFLPRVQSEEVMMRFNMPVGTVHSISVSEVERIAGLAEQLRDKYVDPKTGKSIIKQVFSAAGENNGSGISGLGAGASGLVVFELYPPELNALDVDANGLLAEWRSMIGPIVGAESVQYRAELTPGGQPLQIQIFGQDLAILKSAAAETREFLKQWDGVQDIFDDLNDGKEELRVDLLDAGRALGLTRSDVARQVRQAFYGYEVQRVQRRRSDMRVKVRYPLTERRTIDDIGGMHINMANGQSIPLAHVAQLRFEKGPATITRIDRFRTVNISADLDKDNVIMQALQVEMDIFLSELVTRYPGIRYRYDGEILEQRESLGSIGTGLIFVLAAIYCLLAIPFRSYVQPLIVMSIIPFSLIGVIMAHFMLGKELSMMSVMGSLALAGVVVNDSLVLVDFINRQRGAGRIGILLGIKRAGILRMRPVILTSLTTFIGLMPLLFDSSTQAQFLKPMAISMGFGVLFASSVTLFLVPIVYLILEDLKRLLRTGIPSRSERSASVHNHALSSGKTGGI
jgi:multidrug efflux pump subunit AcrB